MYGKGNREWHVIVEHEGLAQLFERYIKYDRDGSEAEAAEDRSFVSRRMLPDLLVPIDELVDATLIAEVGIQPVAPKLLPSDGRAFKIEPVLTPDNYIDKVLLLITSAEQSVHMQFSYIYYSDEVGDERFTEVLMKLGELSKKPGFDMKVILASGTAAAQAQDLVNGADFKDLTMFKSQANVHNKGIIVDGRSVLVSSANWSSDGALRNRDAGLIIHDPEIAAYFESVFDFDWNNRAKDIVVDKTVMLAPKGAPTPPGMVRISWQEYFEG
jgi:phosphatidylserine/phosphatidylglycerophosphate/cardiolipin synthase-like enzyme